MESQLGSSGEGSHRLQSESLLEVHYQNLEALKPDKRNARTHPKKQVDQLAQSILAFGFTNPILIDQDNVVIAGHGRLLAAKALGFAQAPTIRLSHLNEAQSRALRLADNKIALNSGWDDELLRLELVAVTDPESGVDIAALGFTPMEIDLRLTPKLDPDDDAIPAIEAAHDVQAGDIYALGRHRIGCGDARDGDFLSRVMGEGVVADAAFLDPPYNVSIKNHANVKGKHKDFAMASGEMTESEFQSFLETTLITCSQHSRDGAVHFICMDWRHGSLLEQAASSAYSQCPSPSAISMQLPPISCVDR